MSNSVKMKIIYFWYGVVHYLNAERLGSVFSLTANIPISRQALSCGDKYRYSLFGKLLGKFVTI